jgi:hypothetical protein
MIMATTMVSEGNIRAHRPEAIPTEVDELLSRPAYFEGKVVKFIARFEGIRSTGSALLTAGLSNPNNSSKVVATNFRRSHLEDSFPLASRLNVGDRLEIVGLVSEKHGKVTVDVNSFKKVGGRSYKVM